MFFSQMICGLLVLGFVSTSLGRSVGLTPIERLRCRETTLPLPVRTFETAKNNIDYSYTISFADDYSDCDHFTTIRDGDCPMSRAIVEFEISVRYPFVVKTDYYTAGGRFVTTHTDRSVMSQKASVFKHTPPGKWKQVGFQKFIPQDETATQVLKSMYEEASIAAQESFEIDLARFSTSGLCP
jgi:hypothetical protein